MSRRFGRNQRRKAREHIEALELSRKYYQKQSSEAHERKAQLEDCVQAIAEILGSNFVGLPPELVEVMHGGPVRVHRMDAPAPWNSSWDAMPTAIKSTVEHLQLFEMSTQLERLRGLMHVQVRTPSGQTYAMAEICLKLPRGAMYDNVARYVGKAIVDRVMKEFENVQ